MKKDERKEEIIITLEGDLMEGGSIDVRTLTQVLKTTNVMVQEMARLVRFPHSVSYRVTPPKEKCFEITLQAVQAAAAVLPLTPQLHESVSTIVTYTKAFLDLKRQLKGMQIDKENLHRGSNNTTTIITPLIVGNSNVVNITVNAPYEVMLPAIESHSMNKSAHELAKAIEKDENVDTLKYGFSDGTDFTLTQAEVPYYTYTEPTDVEQNEIVGRVREVDNRDYRGEFELTDEHDTLVKFELDIADIARLEEILKTLCLAEAERSVIVLVGEKIFYKSGQKRGKIKLMRVQDIRTPSTSLGL